MKAVSLNFSQYTPRGRDAVTPGSARRRGNFPGAETLNLAKFEASDRQLTVMPAGSWTLPIYPENDDATPSVENANSTVPVEEHRAEANLRAAGMRAAEG